MKSWDKRAKLKDIESGKIQIDPDKEYSRTQATQILRLSSEAFGTYYRHSRLWLAYEGYPIIDGRAVRFKGSALIRHTEKLTVNEYEAKLCLDKKAFDDGDINLADWYKEGYQLPPSEIFTKDTYYAFLEYND